MILSQDIGHTGAQSDLNPFYGVKDEKAEPAVEDIEIQDILKGDSGPEMVFRVSKLERQCLGTEPVITDDREITFCPGRIRDGKPPAEPLIDVLLYGKGRLAEVCHARYLRA